MPINPLAQRKSFRVVISDLSRCQCSSIKNQNKRTNLFN